MKLIIAHLPTEAFDAARAELLGLGVSRMTISEVHSSGPQSAVTLSYRGTPLRTDLRRELRLECVVTTEQSGPVVNVLRGRASTRWGLGGQVAVMDLEELHQDAPEEKTFADDPRIGVAVP